MYNTNRSTLVEQCGESVSNEPATETAHVNGGLESRTPAAEPAAAETTVPGKRGPLDGANTCLTVYLREIGKVKLLTPEEEIELAARIKKGDQKAREEMIKANLRLVVKIARDYENIGLPLMDLISEGNIGLMKAVERFDPTKGAKLSTYAAWWIKQSIKRALANQSKIIRLPVHIVDKISKMHRAENALHEELDREPTDEELADRLGTSCTRVAQMRVAALRPASLDAAIGSDEAPHTYADVVADENAATPFAQLEGKTLVRLLRDMVKVLDPRDANILRARFGLSGGQPQTLDEIGAKLNVTRERVRQLQDRALRKLRTMLKKLDRADTAFSS